MAQYHTCGHKATFDNDGNYSNGSNASWVDQPEQYLLIRKFGSLCNECMVTMRAKPVEDHLHEA